MKVNMIRARLPLLTKQALLLPALALLAFPALALHARQKPREAPDPQAIVKEWFIRWNALDGSDETASRLLELYLPDASHQTGPSERQSGTATFAGHENIQKMAENFGKRNTAIGFRVEVFTLKEKTASLYHVTETPGGGVSVGVEYVGVYTDRETKKRFIYPGAAFFEIQNGKIRRARFYIAREELAEIGG